MKRKESRRVIYFALVANFGIAVAKFIAGTVTASSAMLAEGIHSLVDTGNEVLLLVGEHRSGKPPDEMHPFGHGRELYFWSFVVAVMIFGVGGGVSTWEGLVHLRHPTPMKDVRWNFIVLGLAFVFEGISWFMALRHFRSRMPDDAGMFAAIRQSKDPGDFLILMEDSAALIGILIAAAGVVLEKITGNALYDGLASIAIGLVLAAVAALLGRETRGLLVGESVDRKTEEGIVAIVRSDPAVVKAMRPLTMQLAPDNVLLNLAIEFRPHHAPGELEQAIVRIEDAVRARYPVVKRIFIEAIRE